MLKTVLHAKLILVLRRGFSVASLKKKAFLRHIPSLIRHCPFKRELIECPLLFALRRLISTLALTLNNFTAWCLVIYKDSRNLRDRHLVYLIINRKKNDMVYNMLRYGTTVNEKTAHDITPRYDTFITRHLTRRHDIARLGPFL